MITREFDLMLYQEGNLLFINANQYDSGEQWIFTLYEENGVKYTPATGAIVGVKSDGHGIINTGTVDEYGRVVINETQQMTAAAGLATFELLIDNDTHGTANFKVDVEPRPADNADLSDSDLSLIQEAVDSAEVIVEVIGDGDPSEVIGEHVDAWLDAHPEATTTVLDGAITAPKINNSLWDKILVNEEASGNRASFDDGADDVPVSSLKVNLEPIQTGTGDPSPTNVRPIYPANGKNLANFVNGYGIDTSGQVVAYETRIATVNPITIKSGVSYKVIYSGNATGAIYAVFNGSTLVRRNFGLASGAVLDTSGGDKLYVCVYAGESVTVTVDSSHAMVIDSSITDFTYQPYQGIMVERCGRNLFDIGGWLTSINASFTITNDGFYNLTPNSAAYSSKFAIPSGIKTVSCVVGADTVATNVRVRCTKADGTFTDIYNGQSLTDNITGISLNWSVEGLISIKVMAEMGSVASAYEPYVGNTYPYTLGQSVYGGTVDLATGVLTVDRVKWTPVATGVSSVTMTDGNAGYRFSNYTQTPEHDKEHVTETLSNFAKYSGNWTTPLSVCPSTSAINTVFICLPSSLGIATVSDFNNWVTTNDYYVVYKLATPTTVQLTPTQVKTLLGYNNISSSGTVEVIYHADTKLYVDKMTSVDNNIIAPTEADFVATRNYTVNDLVIVADTLYKVTANIANGGTITPNSNVQQTTLGALIKALS